MLLTTWNVVNGKHVCTYDRKSVIDLSQYATVWSPGEIVILKFNGDVTVDLKDEDIFEPWQLYVYAEKQRSYMTRCDRNFAKYVVMEIKNESTVDIIMEYDFPYFTQGTTMYFN
jgi:hypothetical protein